MGLRMKLGLGLGSGERERYNLGQEICPIEGRVLRQVLGVHGREVRGGTGKVVLRATTKRQMKTNETLTTIHSTRANQITLYSPDSCNLWPEESLHSPHPLELGVGGENLVN